MSELFRFPHTPHLAWLGDGIPRTDKVLTRRVRDQLLDGTVRVEEKMDGANVGFSIDEKLVVRVQNRGAVLEERASPGQFRSLWSWLVPRHDRLVETLWPDRVLFGEWCAMVHSMRYNALPDWFLGFDVYDGAASRFLDPSERDVLLGSMGIESVPVLAEGRFDLPGLQALLRASTFGSDPMEGLVVRRVHTSGATAVHRAKLVRAEFVQSVGEHWSRALPKRNALAFERRSTG